MSGEFVCLFSMTREGIVLDAVEDGARRRFQLRRGIFPFATCCEKENGGADRDRTDDLLNAIHDRTGNRCFHEVW